MPRLVESRLALLESLEERYGPLPLPGAGPTSADSGETPFASIARVALSLIAEPKVAATGFDALRQADLIEPKDLAEADPSEVDDAFREARVRLSSRPLGPLQRIARWASGRDFDAEAVAGLSTEALREAWRGLNGVGPATADALLLFALGRSAYPVDRASYRILVRHGWLDPSSDYDEARSALEAIAPDDPAALAQLSLAFEKLGRDACKPSGPKCDRCPLRPLLPEGGPVGDEFA